MSRSDHPLSPRSWMTVAVLAVVLLSALTAAASLVTFEPLPLYAVYGAPAGHTPGAFAFGEDGVNVYVEPLMIGGSPYFDQAIVEPASAAFGYLHILHTDNITTTYDFPAAGDAVFRFLDRGGEVNIQVNGAAVFQAPDFPALGGTVVAPGVTMYVAWAPAPGGGIRGRVDLVGPVQKLRIGGQELWLDGVGCDNGLGMNPYAYGSGAPCDHLVSYDLLTPGTVFGAPAGQAPGDVAFTEDGIPVALDVFDAGTGPLFDQVKIVSASWPLGPGGNAAQTNNIGQRFLISALGVPVQEVRFQYVDMGGVENIQVNGAPLYIGELDAAPAAIAPGVTYSVTTWTIPGGLYGEVVLTGNVQDLLVGGQELTLDDICVVTVPDTVDVCDHLSDMESLAPGAVFGPSTGLAPGDFAFSEDGIDAYVDKFDTGAGLQFNDAYVDVAYYGVGSGQTLVTGNVTVLFDMGSLGTVASVTVDYMDWDGIENLQVNGSTLWVDEFEALPAVVAPGITLTVTEWPVPGGRGGRLELTGDVQKLRLGGQQFYLDNVCVELDDGTTAVIGQAPAARPELAPAYPNPFNPSTTLAFSLPRSVPVRLTIHDLAGRLVTTLVDGTLAAGDHTVAWHGDDATGRAVGAGLYFARMTTPDGTTVRRLALIK